MELSCALGISRHVPQEKFPRKPLLVRSRRLDIGLVLFTWQISSHLDRTRLVNNPCILSLFQENGSSSLNGQEYRFAGLSQSTSCDEHTLSHKLNASSVEEPANLVTPSVSAHTKSKQSKRKLLDSIAEPPPLSPLPSSIPASVRREFKRPRQVGTPGNVRLER